MIKNCFIFIQLWSKFAFVAISITFSQSKAVKICQRDFFPSLNNVNQSIMTYPLAIPSETIDIFFFNE